MRPKSFRYFPVKTITAATTLELTGLEDLTRFADLNQLKDVFVLLSEANEPKQFALLYNNSLLQHDSLGYQNIEDFYTAKEADFPNSGLYYMAAKQGYSNYQQFQVVQTAGIESKEEYDLVEKGGFVEGFSQLNAHHIDTGEAIPGNATNALELYKYAVSKEFDDFRSFNDACQKGFDDKDTYALATEKGFPSFATYEEGYERGFDTYEKLMEANTLKVRDFEDMVKYKEVTSESCTDCSCDQQVLVTMLSQQPEGKKQSINKLTEGLKAAMDKFRYKDTEQLPEWFTSTLANRDAIISFLQTNEQVKQFGAYDEDGEYLDVIHRKNRMVVIDGSNVAHNSLNGDRNRPAFYENITRVVTHLQAKGYTDIRVIADNSLKHKVKDQKKLAELKALALYDEVPANTSADIYLLEMVKRNRCLVITNDQFREWCQKDPWTASNIKDYKLNFSIMGEEVMISTATGEVC
jgi:hypothetical protein